MCTAVSYRTKDHYFGRNLDLEMSYGERVIITPRKYEFRFLYEGTVSEHYAIIGMGIVKNDYPLYFDATNEAGLSIAGLNFPDNAVYYPNKQGFVNIASYELIPWILSKCKNIFEVKEALNNINITEDSFSKELLTSPLHWMISDSDESIVVESVKEGLKVYDNPVKVLTNNPPFDYQMFNLNNYMNLSINSMVNNFSGELKLDNYSRGMGGIGMPGDLSSMSRFVRAAFTRMNSVCEASESESVSQFFHILGSVEQQRGLVYLGNGNYEITRYSSCCNANRGIYYYTTYENRNITSVDMHKENLDSEKIIKFPAII